MVNNNKRQLHFQNIFIIIFSIAIGYTLMQIEQHFEIFSTWVDTIFACSWVLVFGVSITAIFMHRYMNEEIGGRIDWLGDLIETWYVILIAAFPVPIYWLLYVILSKLGYSNLSAKANYYFPVIFIYFVGVLLVIFFRANINKK